MIPFATLLTFAGTALLLAVVPGPDNLFVLVQSALRGAKTGIIVTLGLCTGLTLYAFAVAFGVAVIFQTSQIAFIGLKIFGAVYLLYLAYNAFRAKPENLDAIKGQVDKPLKMYLRGIIMNLANPKIAIFFLAFLPQFTSPDWGSITLQMLTLGGVFIICAFVVFAIISLLSGSLSAWLRRSNRSQTILNRVAGVVFVGLALKLATTQQH